MDLEELPEETTHGYTDLDTVEGNPEDGHLLFNHSSHGYSYEFGPGWIMDSQGRNILWLPPNWRSND